MRILKRTTIPHRFNPDGTFRAPQCPGTLEIVSEAGVIITACSHCGEGYDMHLSPGMFIEAPLQGVDFHYGNIPKAPRGFRRNFHWRGGS
jgi:hypothetical protein